MRLVRKGLAQKVPLIVHTLTLNLLLFMCPFVLSTNSVLNRIIITEEISHIKPLRCHLPHNLSCALPSKRGRT